MRSSATASEFRAYHTTQTKPRRRPAGEFSAVPDSGCPHGVCQRIKEYVAKRTAEGLSKKEIIRCLKRAIVREVYRIVCAQSSQPEPTDYRRPELKRLRQARHLTQAQIAHRLGCAPARISDIETGRRQLKELTIAYENFSSALDTL